MKNDLAGFELDNKLKAYMKNGNGQAFVLDESRVFANNYRGKRFINKSRLTAAAVAVLIISVMAVPQVYGVIGKLFTFVPGVGIVEKKDAAIFSMKPVIRKIEPDATPSRNDVYACLENAIYTNGYLSIAVSVEGKNVDFDDFTFYENDISIDPKNFGGSSTWAQKGRFSGYYNIWIETGKPVENDLYDIEIAGFSDRLSFTLDVCSDYYELANIGPTDVQNDISITAIASKSEDRLTVWCYPFNTTGDRITGIGETLPATSDKEKEAYIETEYGFSNTILNAPGLNITERLMFYIPQKANSATLHIPHLTLVRDEKKKLTVHVPDDYVSVPSDIPIQFSIGTVRITEVERKPNENGTGADSLRICFEFEDATDNMFFNSFRLNDAKNNFISQMGKYNEETGRLEYIETEITDKKKKKTFTISELRYHLLGEYIIPLEFN